MSGVRYITKLDECRNIWQALMPRETLTDLWAVRASFHEHFKRQMLFVIHETKGVADGLLPLSFVEECGAYAYFPGETWLGLTWLEQNRIVAANSDVLYRLLEAVPEPFNIRYLGGDGGFDAGLETDEIGYLFHPADCQYRLESHLAELPAKRRSQYKKTVHEFETRGYKLRVNHLPDFREMISMNLAAFEENSYFRDRRFRDGFRRLAQWLNQNGLMRLVSVLVEDKIAAVDFGAIHNGVYTVLAGGVNREFPGVAKLINLHHLAFACEQKMQEVDFLCGDFGWKSKLHLRPRPLYRIDAQPAQHLLSVATA